MRYLLLFVFILGFSPVFAQHTAVVVSGMVKDKTTKEALPYVNVILKSGQDEAFIMGTVSNEEGRFSLANVKPGNYQMEFSFMGYGTQKEHFFVGSLSAFLEVPILEMEESIASLSDVVVTAQVPTISDKMEKKSYSLSDQPSQSGGSVLQALQNLPGISVQDGKVQIRGSEQITILVDGKQTALTGFGSQSGLDNLPASAIDRIEIINNPSSKYDANGNAGIINILYRKNKQEGFNGKFGLTTGAGALWVRKENLPHIRPQYTVTPKINPSLSLNYRKNKVNVFLQADNLYTQTLNKNEFVTRSYEEGAVIRSQLKRNRNTNFFTSRVGVDWSMDEQNMLTVSGLLGTEKIIDRGDQPFFSADLSERLRLWQFLEDEMKTTAMANASFQHQFKQAGHVLKAGFNYTFHREDEQYFFKNTLPTSEGEDSFKLLSDEHVADFNVDYVKPLKYGRLEGGVKYRHRRIPTNMLFFPGVNSPIDSLAGGWAIYKESIPALYGNYVFENERYEAELGVRVEYMGLQYDVNPAHPTYKSDGYHYAQPFPTLRLAYKFNDHNKLSLFYNRRVDRPNEVDIRIFPKYDDAEIIKVGNPALRAQFTNSFELGYKSSWTKGSFYTAAYHRIADGTITRISSRVPGSTLIYAIFQNVKRSYITGAEAVFAQDLGAWYSLNLNANVFRNQINAFRIQNRYPIPHIISDEKQILYSGNIKLNNAFHLPKGLDAQLTAIYLAPDIIPQGRVDARFSADLGLKKSIQKGKGELFMNVNDILNTMVIGKNIRGDGFYYSSKDYYETQVIRFGYSYKF